MQKETFQIDFSDLKLGTSDIERILGDSKDENQNMVSEIISEVLDEAAWLCDIRAEFILFNEISFDHEARSLIIDETRFDIGKIIWGQLKRSESAALFLCTAGEGIGERSRKLINEKDFLKGYIFDIAGSEIVEAAADIIQERLRRRVADSGLSITNRFSPGYCGWNVAEQHCLFRFFPGNYCGIRLTESALMIPIKSVSGVIGIGKNVSCKPYTCGFCDDKHCIYRRKAEIGKE